MPLILSLNKGDRGMDKLLKVKDLKTYFYTDDGVVKAVDGVDFDVESGKTIGIVGESGCGKSITAMSILRLIPSPPGKIVNGRITFNGEDLLEVSENKIRDIRGNDISRAYDVAESCIYRRISNIRSSDASPAYD